MATSTMMILKTGAHNERDTKDYHNNYTDAEMERQKEDFFKENDQTTSTKRKSAEEKTMTKHIETRKKVRSIADMSSFNNLIDSLTISDSDKQLLVLHYIQGKDFRYIGDMLGYSESTIKRKHKRILNKISKIL